MPNKIRGYKENPYVYVRKSGIRFDLLFAGFDPFVHHQSFGF